MDVYLKLISYVIAIKKEVFIKTCLMIAVSITYIVQAILMTDVVNAVFACKVNGIQKQIFLVIVAIIIRGCILRYNEIYTRTMAATIKGKLRLTLLEKIYSLGPGYVSERRSGKITSLILDGIESLEPFYVRYIPEIITVLVSGTFVFIYLVRFDIVSSLVLLLSMVLCVIVPLITVPVLKRSVTDYWTDYSTLTSQYIDAIQGMTTLKTLNAEKTMGEVLNRDATEFWKRSIKNTAISLSNSSLMFILTSITSSVTVAVAAIRAMNGFMMPSAVAAFLFLAVECARPMIELNSAWHASFLGISVVKELFSLMEIESPIQNPKDPIYYIDQNDNNLSIDFCNVSFSYPGNDEEILHSIDISIPGGSTVAIVGASGAGKSTILSLILRFYDVTDGSIMINKKDVRNYDIKSLDDSIGVVFQDTYLFHGSVMDNIRMAAPDADIDRVIGAAKAAYAHDFIMNLPYGYNTIIGERGVTLSGGERQRISIARAIIKDAPVLLLDEATSNVDAESETLIQEALTDLARQRTTVIVAHRLSTIRDADRIFVLDEGRVAEQGTHEKLMAKGGVYSDLIRIQEGFAV